MHGIENQDIQFVNQLAGVNSNPKFDAFKMSYYAWEEFCLLLEVGTKAFDENVETNKDNFLFRRYFKKKEKQTIRFYLYLVFRDHNGDSNHQY